MSQVQTLGITTRTDLIRNSWQVVMNEFTVGCTMIRGYTGSIISMVRERVRQTCTYRAARSNLQMVRPSSMSVVKLLIMHMHEAHGKILDLIIFSSQEVLSLHFKPGVIITLLSCLARGLKFDKILKKHF